MEVPTGRTGFAMPESPKYLQIAADLRAQISARELQPGDALPTTARLGQIYDTSAITVRNAIAVLVREGLVEGVAGGRVRVRDIRRMVRHAHGRAMRSAAGPTSPFARDAEASGYAPTWEHDSAEEPATEEVAARLEIEPGDPVMRTAYRFLADGHPIQLSTSWEPLTITRGTPVERPEEGAAVGVVARFDHIGIRIDDCEERVIARVPTPEEADALQLPPGGPGVQMIRRTYFAAGRPVETCDIVVDSAKYELWYRFPIE